MLSIWTNKRQDNTRCHHRVYNDREPKSRASFYNEFDAHSSIKTELRIMILLMYSLIRAFAFVSMNRSVFFVVILLDIFSVPLRFVSFRIVLLFSRVFRYIFFNVGYARALFCYQCRSVTVSLSVEQPSSQLFEFLFLL